MMFHGTGRGITVGGVTNWARTFFESGSTGNSVTVDRALQGGLQELNVYGWCKQDGTPTPVNPVDIECNNGLIKFRRKSGLPLGFQRVEWIKPTGSIVITGFKTKSTQEITTVFYRESRGQTYLYYSDSATSGTTNTTAYLTTSGGYWRWNGKATMLNPAPGIRITSVQNKDGVWLNGAKYGDYIGAEEFVSTNDLRLSSNENITVRYESQTIREGEVVTLDIVAVQRLSDGVYGFYDMVGGEFYTNTVATITAGDVIDDPIEMYLDGTAETLTITGENGNVQSVTMPMLLGIGEVYDVAKLVEKVKAGKVGIKVFDGTEAFTVSASGAMTTQVPGVAIGAQNTPMNTHFALETSATSIAAGTQRFGANGTQIYSANYYMKHPTITTAPEFKVWLATQFAAGTPVILIYPLEAETSTVIEIVAVNFARWANTVAVNKINSIARNLFDGYYKKML